MRGWLVLGVWLLSSLAAAQPDLPPIGSLGERTLLSWGGGRTREEAEAVLAAYQERAEHWSRVLELGPGYPRLVEGSEVPGMRPGTYAVVLGVCERRAGAELARVFKALEPLATSRWVMWEAGDRDACPSFVPGWTFGGSTRVWAKGGSLEAALFHFTEEGAKAPRGWLVVLGVLGKQEATTTVVQAEEGSEAEAKRLKGGRSDVVLEEWVRAPVCEVRTWSFTARQGELVTKQTKKPRRPQDCAPAPEEAPEE